MAAPDPPPQRDWNKFLSTNINSSMVPCNYSQPDFITFLFSEKPKFDCHFIVGEKTLVKPERFGAVKLMMMAHSAVFRTQLEDSELKEKGDIPVKDMYPDTFRTLLKFIYGHDITGDLEFDEADNMFYAAEKYMMSNLKNKLAVRLIALLTPDNVCSLLNNPAISTQLLLKSKITQILRFETDKVLASPQFLEVCAEGFISILEQDGLAVPEIELWRAAMKWAKHRAVSEDGQVLRRQISGASKHLRICTLTCDEFCQEVVPVGVLSCDEVQLVVKSIGKKEKNEELTEFNNELEPRQRLHKNVKLSRRQGPALCAVPESKRINRSHENWIPRRQKSGLCADQQLKLTYHSEKFVTWSRTWTYIILTKQHAVELMPLVCLAVERRRMDPEGWTYVINCTVKISKMFNHHSKDDTPLTINFSREVEYGETFEVPLAVDGYNVILPANSKYSISVAIIGDHNGYRYKGSYIYENEHMLLDVPLGNTGGKGYSLFPSNCLRYRLADDG